MPRGLSNPQMDPMQAIRRHSDGPYTLDPIPVPSSELQHTCACSDPDAAEPAEAVRLVSGQFRASGSGLGAE